MRRSRAQTRRGVATLAQRQVRVHGQHVTYQEAGVGRGPVVVLLHGLASSSTSWADVMSLLGRRAHVIAPDLLGHGDSAKPHSGNSSLGTHAAGLRDLLAILHTWSGPRSWGTPSAGEWPCSSPTRTPN
jgi:pimeloyl-ACP methyl ester carboxylesterase